MSARQLNVGHDGPKQLTSGRHSPTRPSGLHDLVHLTLRADIHVRQAFDVHASRLVLVYRQVVVVR